MRANFSLNPVAQDAAETRGVVSSRAPLNKGVTSNRIFMHGLLPGTKNHARMLAHQGDTVSNEKWATPTFLLIREIAGARGNGPAVFSCCKFRTHPKEKDNIRSPPYLDLEPEKLAGLKCSRHCPAPTDLAPELLEKEA